MIGGIYCEAGLGPIYDNGTLLSVRQNFKQLVGIGDIIPKGETLNEQIINYWYDTISRKMGRILSSWSYGHGRGYKNRTIDLTRSICLGIYYRGRLRRMYRFSGGSSEAEDNGRRKHPDPAERAKQFLESYDLINKNDFSIVIAATMPYAVRLEYNGMGKRSKTEYGGYNLPVLKLVVNRMLTSVYDFKGSDRGVFYGYVFETGGRLES